MLIEDLQLVLKVAEFRSITKAAANVDMHVATASAAIKRVEASLGMELFIRTTRSLRLSAAGERYIPQCEKALLLLEQAQHQSHDDQNIINGVVRIAVPSDLGRNHALPWIDELMEGYPDIRVKANIGDSPIDFYRDSVDVALRYGRPTDSSLYGFKICNVPRVLCASKEYLQKHGTPVHPQDLAQHNGLFYQLYDQSYNVWSFSRDGVEHKIKMTGNRAANDGELVRRWCVAGKGIAEKSCLDMSQDLLAGRVVNLMPEFTPTSTELWLIYPSRQIITPTIRLLRDTFKEKTRKILSELVEQGILDQSVLR